VIVCEEKLKELVDNSVMKKLKKTKKINPTQEQKVD
jgi:hypothetical protein